MSTNGSKTAQPSPDKALRSKKIYFVAITVALAVVLFILYYSFFVSSQQAYFNDRAFRVLSTMGDKFSRELKGVRDVLAASATYPSQDAASAFAASAKPDLLITGFSKKGEQSALLRNGVLTVFALPGHASLRLGVEYREPPSQLSATTPVVPCQADSATTVLVCGEYDFGPLVHDNFQVLDEDFFDDVLIADSHGDVLFQESSQGPRITNLAASISPAANNSFWQSITKSNPDASSTPTASETRALSFAAVSDSSNLRNIELAGSDYKLYLQPLGVYLQSPAFKAERRLALCGLRTLKHSEAETLSLPYTYTIWGVLTALAIFAVGWPLLKILYMSPKERLQNRHVLYLIASAMIGTMLATLIVLNFSYKSNYVAEGDQQLTSLADGIQANVGAELRSILTTLDALSSSPDLLARAGTANNWNQADFMRHPASQKFFSAKHGSIPSYPFFRFFFVADEKGWQQLKLNFNPYATPRTNIRTEPYFPDVVKNNLSCLPVQPSATSCDPGKDFRFRLQPLRSPNTGEFLVLIATPFKIPDSLPAAEKKRLEALHLRVSVLAVKMESLVSPVLPLGYGFAVVNGQGLVQFHSVPARNLAEDFSKESRDDKTLSALLENRGTDVMNATYMGTDKRLRIAPLDVMGEPALSLIVFRDSSYFNTLNAAVIVIYSLLFTLYIVPFVLVVVVHMIRQRDHPLEGIWPSAYLLRCYFHIFIVNVFLAIVFFARYTVWNPTQAFLYVLAIAFIATVYPLLERRAHQAADRRRNYSLEDETLLPTMMQTAPEGPQERARVLLSFSKAAVVTLLAMMAGWSWYLLFALLFAIMVFTPASRLGESSLIGRLPLRYAYTLMAISIAMSLAVVPTFGFFQISYNYVHRIFRQEEQLELAESLDQRHQAIQDLYAGNGLAWLAKTRLDSSFDRYDQRFLNGLPASSPEMQPLVPGKIEKFINYLVDPIHSNRLGTELRELARAIPPPQVKWTLLSEPNGSARLKLAGLTDVPLVSAYPKWPGLDAGGRFLLILVVILLAAWLHFVHTRIFLLDVPPVPPLDRWRREPRNSTYLPHYLLVIGHPKSGKTLAVKRIGAQILDFAKMATEGKWELEPSLAHVVALDHFEFAIDNPDINQKKLQILEELIYVRHKRVIILSTIDLMYFLGSCGAGVLVAKGTHLDAAIAMLDRWGAVLASFRKVRIDDISERNFRRSVERACARRNDPAFFDFVKMVERECDHTAHLRKIGKSVLRAHSTGHGISREKLIQEILDRADAYYRVLWSTCTQDERLVLFQLAEDGWANSKNELAIQQLERKGLVRESSGLRLINESFRRFVRRSQYREEIAHWEHEGEQSLWRSLKLSLGVIAGLVMLWLLYSQQQFFNVAVSYISALGAAAAVVVKLLSDLRGGKSSPSAGRGD